MKFPLARTDLTQYAALEMPEAPAAHRGLTATFLGVSTVLITDGATAVMTDGFFTRPGLRQVLFGKLSPDADVIAGCLQRAGVTSLAAIACAHSHYDHAMDAPVVAQRTGAVLVGSESTANIGRGHGLPEGQIRVVTPGEPMRFGTFELTLVESEHSPNPHFEGSIDEPFTSPAKAKAWAMGECYSIFVDHDLGTVLVHGSSNYRAGVLAGQHADAVYLGTTLLSKGSHEFRELYWHEVVLQVGARRVIPVHWDDFSRPLSQPLVSLPFFGDDFEVAMSFLREAGERDGVEIAMPVAWRRCDPLAGVV